ncbi:MAG TPA: molybdopterin molybdotransferase MoeA, partial [Sandaracinaceae bacterium LLY-WYZ-13_1]|nr:molybdopterin molybdotransferase MoeA [Sandaracinaceae bacterium LLY-WYZ-13_1]
MATQRGSRTAPAGAIPTSERPPGDAGLSSAPRHGLPRTSSGARGVRRPTGRAGPPRPPPRTSGILRPGGPIIPIADAIDQLLPRFEPLPAERVPLDRALGRFLAAPLAVREDVPGFDNSAMDGYAVLASDVAGASADAPIALPVLGESRAGGPPPGALREGTAMRIFTGAAVPEGADAIVIQEDTERKDQQLSVRASSAPGKHIRRRAEVLAAGDVLLEPGAALGAGEIGLCASQAHAFVPVHRRPRVAILSTGDELREIGEPPRFGSLIDSNAHCLAAAVRAAGAEPTLLPLGADDLEVLTAGVRDALASHDVLLSTGGVSVGAYDLLHRAFADAGVQEVFWKIRVKPGKPVRFGVAGRVPVVGLPGNPVSALVTFEVFVRPGLRRMLGDPRPFRPLIDAVLAAPMRAPKSRTELARVRFEDHGPPPRAVPHPARGSAALNSLVALDALAVLP